MLGHSLTTGKTIIIDKNIKLERIGRNTQWKIDFTNYIQQHFGSSYEWLNHMRLSKLREFGLLILRNHLNQQMIRQFRTEINHRLQQAVQSHLDEELRAKTMTKNKFKVQNKRQQKTSTLQTNLVKQKDEIDYSMLNSEDFNEQKVQNVINELNCLQSLKNANQLFEFRGGFGLLF